MVFLKIHHIEGYRWQPILRNFDYVFYNNYDIKNILLFFHFNYNIFIVEMGKNKFDRKKAVKFILVPGPIKDGKPTVLYKPAENVKTRVPKK